MSNVVKKKHVKVEPFCKYIHRQCTQIRLEGYDYCIRHILVDKSAPFQQCAYVLPSNKRRCTNAAPQTEKHEMVYCPFHVKQALLKNKSYGSKRPIVKDSSLLGSLERHSIETKEKHDILFKEHSSNSNNIDQSYDTDSVEKKTCIENLDDDFTSVPKPGDCLEHAGVFTYKEIVRIAKEKIFRLQQLYCEELKLVHRQLKENKRNFLTAMTKSPDPDIVSTNTSCTKTEKKELKTLCKYHNGGPEKVLRCRARDKRTTARRNLARKSLCSFIKKGIECKNEAIVFAKFCKQHILHDPHQVLFKQCQYGKNCHNPILPFQRWNPCIQHFHLIPTMPEVSKPSTSKNLVLDVDHSQLMDDMASLGLDVIPSSFLELDRFNEPVAALSEDILQVSDIPPADILSEIEKQVYE